MAIGKRWTFFGTRRGMIILIVPRCLLLLFLHYYSGCQSSDRSASCQAGSVNRAV